MTQICRSGFASVADVMVHKQYSSRNKSNLGELLCEFVTRASDVVIFDRARFPIVRYVQCYVNKTLSDGPGMSFQTSLYAFGHDNKYIRKLST
jgi:hypothetical protein